MANARPITYAIDENGCWNCTSHKPNTNGYPVLHRNGKCTHLSRFIYLMKIGPIQDGLVVRHKCDNRRCINPDHLETGTHTDNMQDMIKRDRRIHQIGSINPHAKLTENTVKEILLLLKDGKKQADVARIFCLNRKTVNNIVLNRTWKHIGGKV